ALEAAVGARGTRVLVVDEHDAVTDEDLVLDRHAVAYERVALHLAAGADARAALNLDERPDARPVPDRAAVEVRERADPDVVAEVDVVEEAADRLVDWARRLIPSHRRRRRRPRRPPPAARPR